MKNSVEIKKKKRKKKEKNKKNKSLGPKIRYFGIFGMLFWKVIVIWEINTLEVSKAESYMQKWKSLDLGQTFVNALCEYF